MFQEFTYNLFVYKILRTIFLQSIDSKDYWEGGGVAPGVGHEILGHVPGPAPLRGPGCFREYVRRLRAGLTTRRRCAAIAFAKREFLSNRRAISGVPRSGWRPRRQMQVAARLLRLRASILFLPETVPFTTKHRETTPFPISRPNLAGADRPETRFFPVRNQLDGRPAKNQPAPISQSTSRGQNAQTSRVQAEKKCQMS
jgi:hypothetical protein